MAQLTANVQAININDLFLVQRPADNNLYRVSAQDIGIFSSNYIHEDFEAVKLEFKDIQNQLDMINNQLLTTIKTITTDHDIRIKVLEDKTDQIILDIEETNTSIEDIVAKTRMYLYHRLMDYEEASAEGEMVVRRKDGGPMEGLQDVQIIEYFLSSTQNIANVFEKEVLELTCQSGATNDGGFVTHRAVYNIDFISVQGSLAIIEVTVRNAIGNGFPFYQRGLLNEVRTDIYPVFTISKEEYETGIDSKYDKAGGTLTGDLTIEKTGTAQIYLQGSSGGRVKFTNALIFSRDNGSEVFRLEQNYIQAKKPINLNLNKIINIGTPSQPNEAATKGYVDELFASNDITEDQLFHRGDAVTGQSPGTTKNGGFFYQSGSLYYKV